MININLWLEQCLPLLHESFGDRIWFMGLQGSYGRGEATDQSDIDLVLILDEMSISDLQTYRNILNRLPYRELICGFVSGKMELLNWDPSDLFQFYYDTTPIIGTLDELLSFIDADAVNRAIKIGAGNIYHGAVHNFLHEQNADILKSLYKLASFVLRAIYFQQTGKYARAIPDLLPVVEPNDQVILNHYLAIKRNDLDLAQMSQDLVQWSGSLIRSTRK